MSSGVISVDKGHSRNHLEVVGRFPDTVNKVFLALEKKSLLIYTCQSTVHGIILSLFHNTGKQRWEKQNRKQQTGRSSAALISQFADVR